MNSMYSMLLLHVGSGECQNDRASMNRVPAPRIRRRRTKRLMCSCDAEFNPQSVAVDNVVTDPPTEKNQILPREVERVEVEEEHKQPSSSNSTLLLEQRQMNVIAETATNDVPDRATDEQERNAQLMKRKNIDDSEVDENTPENTNNPIYCEFCLPFAPH